jgi:leader peptidase (prepilin peptidase)/N-methyltransferase
MTMFAAAAAVTCWLVLLSVVDLRARRLPDVLTLPGAVVILAVAAFAGRGGSALVGALCFAGFYLVVHLVSPRAMGAGDVKLALGLGALCGAVGLPVLVVTVVLSSLLSALAGIVLLVRGRRCATIAHGASMCLAAQAALVFALV